MLTRIPPNCPETQPDRQESPGYVLYQFVKADGSFDYGRYLDIQQRGNKEKINNVWVIEDNIAFLARYIQSRVPAPRFGICHGTRRGKEQEWFRSHLGCEVVGTEISETAHEFPHTIQWDFHDVRPEWVASVDFIYSNSFDHSYDPEKCLNAWMSCLRPGGIALIEHSSLHEPEGASELDPFGADIVQMPYLVTTWGRGRYGVRELLTAPVKSPNVRHVHFVVVQHFPD